ncbi:helix-turn-helix domain-containing protein [Pengzhenrongella sicca]|uniref:Helix-turn-helix domain-containing protein n=1 Tax=Pengzhenrongella sicca TaxID=2819238 RepID=A0A8A4ZG04_9MICO|nr:helix-turn-helix transcriptional regulator [Pengzhenrongella sicca]QTE30952.1 helix-turn-helix domain-containing protein [Pengzhenrongella sicca]
MTPPDATALGEFLQARRARITPQEAGVTLYGDRRRVPGLRREELALLAGVSSSYYTRLEQGQSRSASVQVLDSIATALRLNDAERAHIHSLARSDGRRPAARRQPVERADPALAELVDALGDVPALILGRRSDVLRWNPLGHALLAGHLDAESPLTPRTRPNMAEIVFLDAHTRSLYTDWRTKSRTVVGSLRIMVAQHPADPALASMIGGLTIASPEFACLWASHRVQACSATVFELDHPLVGTLTVTQQTLRSATNPDQALVTHTAAAGSPSAEALTLLAQIVRTARATGTTRTTRTTRTGAPNVAHATN